MQTHIREISEVAREFVIDANAEDLADAFRDALRRQRNMTQLKGFRPGKAPLGLIKRIHGKALAHDVAEKKVHEAFRTEILESDEYDVVGRGALTTLDHEMDGGLHAVIRFGVRPDVQLKDISGEKIPRLRVEVTDEDVVEQLERIRRARAEFTPVEEEAIGELDRVVVDVQRLDETTATPLIGKKSEGVTLSLDDERLDEGLRQELLGRKTGDTFVVDFSSGGDGEGPPDRYRITIREALQCELPELDDALARKAMKDESATLDDWKKDIRRKMENEWKKRSDDYLIEHIVQRMLELHDIPVPEEGVDAYLDDFVDRERERNKGRLPEDFDERAFREDRRSEAAKQAKWAIIRDALVKREGMEVTDDDIDAHFEKSMENMEGDKSFSGVELQAYYRRTGRLESIRQTLTGHRVFEFLIEAFELEDMNLEAFTAFLEEQSTSRVQPW